MQIIPTFFKHAFAFALTFASVLPKTLRTVLLSTSILVAHAQTAMAMPAPDIQAASATVSAQAHAAHTAQPEQNFKYTNEAGTTTITEKRDGVHAQRDIEVHAALGTYRMSKPMSGAVNTQEQKNRTTQVRILDF